MTETKKIYYRLINTETSKYLIPPIAEIVAEYVTPKVPTDVEIGKYDIGHLAPTVMRESDYIEGLAHGNHLDKLMKLIKENEENKSLPKLIFKDLALHGACEVANRSLIATLLEMGADKSMGLEGACEGNNIDIARDLITPGDHKYALYSACKNNNLELVKLLINNGTEGWHGIEIACALNHKDIINYLLSLDSSPSMLRFALTGAIIGKQIDLIKELINKGAEISANHIINAHCTQNKELIDLIIPK